MKRSQDAFTSVVEMSQAFYNVSDDFSYDFPFLQTAFHLPAITGNSPHRDAVLRICHTNDNNFLGVSQVHISVFSLDDHLNGHHLVFNLFLREPNYKVVNILIHVTSQIGDY